jgi:transcriptional regulator with XRE-family HTH domain
MKKNPKLEEIRKRIPKDVKIMIDHSFEVVDRIDEIMKKKNITQRSLADMLGKSESEISKWMRGTHNFTFKTISKLEAVLGESILSISSHKPAVFVFQVQSGESSTPIVVKGTIGRLNNSPRDFHEDNTVDISQLCDQLN